MPTPPTRLLEPNEAKMGLYMYALIYDWKSWVHRRVEHVMFTGTVIPSAEGVSFYRGAEGDPDSDGTKEWLRTQINGSPGDPGDPGTGSVPD